MLSTQNTIKIIIADDHELFAEGLKLLISQNERMDVRAIASDGRELLEIVKQDPPNIVLLDINMPNINGFDAIRYLKMHNIALKIMVLSTYAEMHVVARARNLGADGYILKNSNRDQLIAAIEAVINGESPFPNITTQVQIDQLAHDSVLKSSQLSAREIEIMQLIKLGLTNKKIARELSLSLYTVETHRKNIMRKLQLRSPSALMKFIIENNL